ncbi:54S ribosomal protein L23, mitochondrial [Cichlidogyrus casuarinus]|uniref:Large ribosomal subunit protein uL23m n=1 Tax=Cichlidogyrus casuarinus TaxID=1844966 RepID=A0ABD2PRW4_9PLAT
MRPVIFVNPISLPKTSRYIPLWRKHVEYPLYNVGDPKIRMFLVPFWMKLINPSRNGLQDQVVFKVHPQMSKYDVKQYLEKLYSCPVLDVRTKLVPNDLRPADHVHQTRYRITTDPLNLPPDAERYEKFAYVRLPQGSEFEFPKLFEQNRPSKALEQFQADQEKMALKALPSEEAGSLKDTQDSPDPKSKTVDDPNVPSWFS